MRTLPIETLGFEQKYSVSELLAQKKTSFQKYEFHWNHSEPKPCELKYDTRMREDVVIEVLPSEGDPWVGHFRSGAEGMSGIFGTPSPDIVCVVASGQGYWVPVSQPDQYREIQTSPVLNIFAIVSRNMLVFGDFTELEAYGPKNRIWVTDRLSWDGIEITEATKDAIRGKAWDSPADKQVEFFVDPRDGSYVGGSSPEAYRNDLSK